MKKSILTALVVLAMATVASAGTTGIMRGAVNPKLHYTPVMSSAPQASVHEENVSLALLEKRCVMLADTQPWQDMEHNVLGVKFTTEITNPETDIERCKDAVKSLSSIIGEMTGAITDEEKREALKQTVSILNDKGFIESFEALAFENFHTCTSVAAVNSDFGFIGSHNRFERCRSAINELHKVFSGSVYVKKSGYKTGFSVK